MVDGKGVPKGLQQVLHERGVDIRKMKKDMVEWLQQLDDLNYDLNTVHCYLFKDLGHRCISLPKQCIHQICIYFRTAYSYAKCYTVSLI